MRGTNRQLAREPDYKSIGEKDTTKATTVKTNYEKIDNTTKSHERHEINFGCKLIRKFEFLQKYGSFLVWSEGDKILISLF